MVVDMVPNALLRPTNALMPAGEFGPRFAAAIASDPAIQMAYGRLSVARRDFLRQAMMITYRPVPNQPARLPPVSSGGLMSSVSREIFRAQIGSETGKRARWAAETVGNPSISSGIATRSTLMNEPVANLAGRDPFRTDILHEYFVAPERFDAFLTACRDTILRSRQDLLNVTLRYVKADPVSVLSYAPVPRIAAVMLFSQSISPEAEADMLQMTEALIERVIAIGGSFYLPYRLHARRDQAERSYPNLARFLAKKREIDPGLLFRNAMWDTYFA
jgi:FAD/FMN-containing dehydrogenase